MKFAERYDVTVDGLAHDEYLSDGVLADAFLNTSRRRQMYEHICALTLRFLDIELKGAAGPLGSAGDAALHTNRKPPHRLPPTALELLVIFDHEGPEKTRHYLESSGEEFDGEQLFALGSMFLADGRTQDALRISRWAIRYWPKLPGSHAFQGEVLATTGDVGKAREAFRKALELVDRDKSLSPDQKSMSRAVIEKTMRVLPQ
jgi:tetratricopeptide (TPR) repeat protein